MNRRMFLAGVVAASAVPVTPEAPHRRAVEVQQADGVWRVCPNKLLDVRNGQRFRMHETRQLDSRIILEATADSHGEWGIDADGKANGEIYWVHSTIDEVEG